MGAYLLYVHLGSEAEDLEAAAIRQNRSIPAHESMQSAGGLDDFKTRAQHEVIGVREHDLGAGGSDLRGEQRFDSRLSSDRHEDRSFDLAAGRVQTAAPGSRRRATRE